MNSRYRDYRYDSPVPTWSHRYLIAPLRGLLVGAKGPILDLGCGNGAIARVLLNEGYDVYGLDASDSGIRIASDGVPARFFVLDLSTGQLPAELAGKDFKTVISTEVIEHLYDPRGLIAFARRILFSGGVFIVSTPYHGYLKNLTLAVSGKLDAHFTVLWDGGHIKFFSRQTLEQMLREQGFAVTRFTGAGRLPFFWKSMLLKAEVAG